MLPSLTDTRVSLQGCVVRQCDYKPQERGKTHVLLIYFHLSQIVLKTQNSSLILLKNDHCSQMCCWIYTFLFCCFLVNNQQRKKFLPLPQVYFSPHSVQQLCSSARTFAKGIYLLCAVWPSGLWDCAWIIMLMHVPPALSSVPAGLLVIRKCFALTEE